MHSLDRQIKEKAIIFRQKGYSLKEISDRLKISKSTASLWLKDISLNERALLRIKKRALFGINKSKRTKKKLKQELFKKINGYAENDIKAFIKDKRICRIICSILFWCEGNKNTTRIRFTNSDPEMIRTFLTLFRKGFNSDEKKFRALLHLHNYHSEKNQIDYWSRITSIPVEQFNKSFQKTNTGIRERENYQGCIAISYYDAILAKRLLSYYKVLQKLAV